MALRAFTAAMRQESSGPYSVERVTSTAGALSSEDHELGVSSTSRRESSRESIGMAPCLFPLPRKVEGTQKATRGGVMWRVELVLSQPWVGVLLSRSSCAVLCPLLVCFDSSSQLCPQAGRCCSPRHMPKSNRFPGLCRHASPESTTQTDRTTKNHRSKPTPTISNTLSLPCSATQDRQRPQRLHKHAPRQQTASRSKNDMFGLIVAFAPSSNIDICTKRVKHQKTP